MILANPGAEHDIALGASTFDNRIYGNVGLKTLFKEAGEGDRNHISLSDEGRIR